MRKTKDEMIAVGLLMGLVPLFPAGYYVKMLVAGTKDRWERFDMETLEPITYDEMCRRRAINNRIGRPWRELTDEERNGACLSER